MIDEKTWVVITIFAAELVTIRELLPRT